MELWIRSQDKNILCETIHLELSANKLSILGLNKVHYGVVLGTYKTKERALEVLDEIQKLLMPQLIIKDSGKIIGSFEDTIIRDGATYELKELSTYVYEMPNE